MSIFQMGILRLFVLVINGDSQLQLTMSKNDKSEEDSHQDYLRKLEQQSSEKKRQEALKILHRSQPTPSMFNSFWKNVQQKLSIGYQSKKTEFIRQAQYSQNKHLVIITLFFLGAIFVSWKIEEKYDRMRDRAKNTKSLKTRQVQVQNDYIQKMLARNPFEPVPIQQEQKDIQDYIYQKAEIEFDTRADLLQIMQHEKGLLPNEQIEQL